MLESDARPADLESLDSRASEVAGNIRTDDPLFRFLDREWAGYWQDPDSYYRWLAGCVTVWQPTLAVELGGYTGAGTLGLFSVLPTGSRLVSVDVRRDHRFVPPEAQEDSRLQIVIGDDLDLQVFGPNPPTPIDFLFVDTVHRKWQVEREWAIYKHLLAPSAIVVFDDIRVGDMGAFWRELEGEKLDLTDKRHRSGFGVLFHRGNGPEVELARMASERAISERATRKWVDRRDGLMATAAAWKARARSLFELRH
jgi:hypothetical protein